MIEFTYQFINKIFNRVKKIYSLSLFLPFYVLLQFGGQIGIDGQHVLHPGLILLKAMVLVIRFNSDLI